MEKNKDFYVDISEYIKYILIMAKKKIKMGRPALKAKDKRTSVVTMRLKKIDHDELEKEAQAKGLTISGYLLECWQKSRIKKL